MGKGRRPCCDKAGVKKGPWSQVEDFKLISFIQNHGHSNWRALPKLAGLARCGKSCRLRWVNYLRPDLKRGNFSPQEEEAIIKLHGLLGNRWSKIASHFPGRTDNEIKNIWNTHLKKRVKAKAKEHNNDSPTSSNTLSAGSSLNEVLDDENNKGCSEQVLMHPSTIGDTIEHSASSSTSNSSQASFADHQTSKFNPEFVNQEASHSGDIIEQVCDHKDETNIGMDNTKGEDSLEELIEIPFEPNFDLWDLLDGDSNSANSEVRFDELEAPLHPIFESDNQNNRERDGSCWWLVYLENELGLDHLESTPPQSQATNGSNDELLFKEEESYLSNMVI